MKIYTSNFSSVKNLVKQGIVPIGTVIFPPKWYTGLNYQVLAPRPEMLKMSETVYVLKYMEILARLKPEVVIQDLVKLGNGKDVALLCFEKPGDFCHRQLVCKWLNDFLESVGSDVKVSEFVYDPFNVIDPGPSENDLPTQTSLF